MVRRACRHNNLFDAYILYLEGARMTPAIWMWAIGLAIMLFIAIAGSVWKTGRYIGRMETIVKSLTDITHQNTKRQDKHEEECTHFRRELRDHLSTQFNRVHERLDEIYKS